MHQLQPTIFKNPQGLGAPQPAEQKDDYYLSLQRNTMFYACINYPQTPSIAHYFDLDNEAWQQIPERYQDRQF